MRAVAEHFLELCRPLPAIQIPVCLSPARSAFVWVVSHPRDVFIYVVLAGAAAAFLFFPVDGIETLQLTVRDVLAMVCFWILMGVLSSVGLGSGLHTFLLYTGPHIIRVSTAAVACNSLDFSAHVKSYGIELEYDEDAFDCPAGDP